MSQAEGVYWLSLMVAVRADEHDAANLLSEQPLTKSSLPYQKSIKRDCHLYEGLTGGTLYNTIDKSEVFHKTMDGIKTTGNKKGDTKRGYCADFGRMRLSKLGSMFRED